MPRFTAAHPCDAPAGRICRHDILRRQVAVGRLGAGADSGGAGRPAGYSPARRCRHDGLCRDAARLCPPRPGRRGGVEAGELGWISFQHYTARPAVDIERRDREGRAYTDIREVPFQTADPQLHTHVTVLNSVLTDSGHRRRRSRPARRAGQGAGCGLPRQCRGPGPAAWHRDRARRAHRRGAARRYPAFGARRCSASGRSKRRRRRASLRRARGIDWDAHHRRDQKIALLKAGAAETRQAKTETAEGLEEKAISRCGASRPRPPPTGIAACLRPDQVTPARPAAERHETAYRAALPLLEGELSRRAVLDGQELREIAARALIVAGIGDRPGDDIEAVLTGLPRARRGAGRGAGGAAVGEGGAAARQGALECHDGVAYRPGTRIDPAGQDRVARFLGRVAAGCRSTAPRDAFLERNPTIDPAAGNGRPSGR